MRGMPISPGPPPDRDHWSRLRPQLEALLELEGDAREAALLERFPGESDRALARTLLAEVEADDTDTWSIPPVEVDPSGLVSPPPLDEVKAERVGPWELRRRIGAGGMGEVWLAVRADGHFVQRAAFKRIRAEMHGAEVVARFERERQVLANLDHPGIARLLDGGVDEVGRPFLVMEFIDGVPIDLWCNERRVDVRGRVRLLVEVARAVDAAHALLVVHRDLKPSNILVDQADRPRLIDFGVAKVLDPEKDAAAQVTRDITRYVTPAYASPEQLTGERVSPASDVYSLGALAYQLLTGRPPLDVSGRPPAEAVRILVEEDPPAMSIAVRRSSSRSMGDGQAVGGTPDAAEIAMQRGTTAAGLVESLRGDLDTVISACLCKESVRRYARAGDLADDLDRWLEGQPVKAHADGVLYRVRRFCVRNRGVVAATVLAFVILVAGLVVVITQQDQLRTSRDALATRSAESERLLADLRESVGTMMSSYYAELAAIPGTDRVLGRMVRATSAVAERQGDPELLVNALRAQSFLARALWMPFRDSSSDPAGALAAHERARKLALKIAASNSTEGNAIWVIAEARVAVLGVMYEFGQLEAALEEADDLEKWLKEKAVSVPEPGEDGAASGPPTYNPGLLVQIVAMQSRRANVLAALGRSEEAEEVFASAIAAAEAFDLSGTMSGLEMDDMLTFAYRGQAELLSARGEIDLARAATEKARALAERAWAGHVSVKATAASFAFELLSGTENAESEGPRDSSWIALLDATDVPEATGESAGESAGEAGAPGTAAERRAWRQLSPANRARLHEVAARWESEAERYAEAARHARRAVELVEELLEGRERVWIESRLLRSMWLVRGQAAAQNGELLEASRFLGLALGDAEAALTSEPRDVEARRVAVDCAQAFAELETGAAATLAWEKRAEALLAAGRLLRSR